jgi:hypothetical protein
MAGRIWNGMLRSQEGFDSVDDLAFGLSGIISGIIFFSVTVFGLLLWVGFSCWIWRNGTGDFRFRFGFKV